MANKMSGSASSMFERKHDVKLLKEMMQLVAIEQKIAKVVQCPKLQYVHGNVDLPGIHGFLNQGLSAVSRAKVEVFPSCLAMSGRSL